MSEAVTRFGPHIRPVERYFDPETGILRRLVVGGPGIWLPPDRPPPLP